jgi:hypothetical protein
MPSIADVTPRSCALAAISFFDHATLITLSPLDADLRLLFSRHFLRRFAATLPPSRHAAAYYFIGVSLLMPPHFLLLRLAASPPCCHFRLFSIDASYCQIRLAAADDAFGFRHFCRHAITPAITLLITLSRQRPADAADDDFRHIFDDTLFLSFFAYASILRILRRHAIITPFDAIFFSIIFFIDILMPYAIDYFRYFHYAIS